MSMATNCQPGKTLSESINFMFEKEIDTDIAFRFPNSDETLKAHRLILKARSRVFYTMFHSGLDKPGEDMVIPDIEPAIFKEFLRYLYLDETRLTTTKALQLSYCAEKYEVNALKAECLRFLLEQVNETTWAEIIDHAVFFNEESLTQACLHFFTSSKSLDTEGLEDYHITRETLEVILDYEEHSVREADIFKFCQTWSEQECEKMEVPINMVNKRKMLGPLLRKIPFCSMKQAEFVSDVSGKCLLNGEEELQILRYFCATDKTSPPFPLLKLREAKDVQVLIRQPDGDEELEIFRYLSATSKATSLSASMKSQESKDKQVLIKLPDVWNSSEGEVYTFSIKCTTQSFTLIGLTFTEPGTFLVSYGSITECLEVQDECLTVYMKEAVRCEAETMLNIQDARFEYPQRVKIDYPFSSFVNLNDSNLYKKLDFVIAKHHDVGKPPFDTLIVQL